MPFKESADALTQLLSMVVKDGGFDGLYLDGYIDPRTYKPPAVMKGRHLDYDGDGEADNPEAVVKQYQEFGPYFVAELRKALGPSAVILANSAGPNADPNLNGLTIEMEACTDLQGCLGALKEAEGVGTKPPVSVLWLTHSEAMSPEQQCERAATIQATLGPWVQAGTDFFDGSCIVCNNTQSRLPRSAYFAL
jgi:hypothetical protein